MGAGQNRHGTKGVERGVASDSERGNISTTNVQRAPGRSETPRIAPVFTRMGIIDVAGDYVFRSHRHPQYEVILVDRGRYRCKVNGQEFSLCRNDVVVVKPGDWHEDYCRPPLRYFGLTFHLQPDWDEVGGAPRLFAENVPPEMQIFRIRNQAIWQLVRRLQEEADRPDPFSAHVQDAVLLEFFWHMVRALPREAVSEQFLDVSLQQIFPAQLLRLFRMNIAQPLSIGEMAERMGMSESSLAHKCKAMLGVSPARAFLKARLERAATLLRTTSMLTKEIAPLVGFDNPYVFSRAFKRLHGTAPDHYRKKTPFREPAPRSNTRTARSSFRLDGRRGGGGADSADRGAR